MWLRSEVPVNATMPTAKAKRNHLRDGGAQPARDRRRGRSAQLALVGGQEGEPLVDDAALATDLTDLLVPPGPGVAAVLHERRRDRGRSAQRQQLITGDVAHSQEPRPPFPVQPLHRAPHAAKTPSRYYQPSQAATVGEVLGAVAGARPGHPAESLGIVYDRTSDQLFLDEVERVVF